MSDFKALAKHSANYFAATIATKALAFISIPVYTRLLTVAEYGVMQIFLSTTGIVQVLLTLDAEVAVSRYFFDAKNEQDFKEFVSTTIKVTLRIWCLMTVIMLLCVPWLAKELSFSYLLTIAIIPVASYQVINSIFTQIYQPLLQSRKVAIVSSIQVYLAFVLSVIYILLLKHDKYYGYVLGTISAMLILSVYLINQIKPFYVKNRKKKEHVSYILKYCLPYIPYTLSGLILAQFGKIVMNDYGGFETAGVYSFTANIGALMLIVLSVTDSAWSPYYFRYMTEKDYKSVEKDYNLIWRLSLICGLGLSLFGKEIGIVLGKPEYLGCLYLLPILVVGYIFYQWSYVYLRGAGFAKRMIWNAVAVLIAGVCNVCLNVVLVQRYAEVGIAISFAFSYMIMVSVSYLINKLIIRVYTPNVMKFVIPFLATIPFLTIAGYINYKGTSLDFIQLLLKMGILILFSTGILLRFIITWWKNKSRKKTSLYDDFGSNKGN